MKKMISVLLALLLALSLTAAAFAEETPAEGAQEEVREVDGLRYALSGDDTVLTVWLDANETTGYAWEFEISDENLLELITQEYVADENPGDMVGVGGEWAASFFVPLDAPEGTGGNVTLKLIYRQAWEPKDDDVVREIHLWVVENGQLEVLEVK